MPLLKSTPAKSAETKAPEPPPAHEKPKAAMRPGTSGTEALLVTNTRKASDRFKQAQRAERTYIAKKRSAIARANFSDAKSHYKESASHLKSAITLTFAVMRMSPYLVSEKNEARQLKADERKRRRLQDQQKRLEEQIARDQRTTEHSDSDDEGEPSGPKIKETKTKPDPKVK
jgi:hypothetical protein